MSEGIEQHPSNPGRRAALRKWAGIAPDAALPPMGTTPGEISLLQPIPSAGEPVPAVGLGTRQAFDVAGDPAGIAKARETLRFFVEAGGRIIDSSPMYGSSENTVGDLAADLKLQGALFIATKVWTSGRDKGIEQMEQSESRLRTRPIDLMQVHNLLDLQTHLGTLRALKQQGRIRYFGITHYTISAQRTGSADQERTA